MGAEALESYLGGSWSRGHGAEIELVDPTNGSVLADVLAANRATGALVDPVAMVFTLDSTTINSNRMQITTNVCELSSALPMI
jgi:hypothetical protein